MSTEMWSYFSLARHSRELPLALAALGFLFALPLCVSASAATGPVAVFHSAGHGVECADEPADAFGLHPGINCFSGHHARGCDGEVVAVTGVGPYGRTFGVHRGCTGGTPLDYGEEPTFKVLGVGQRIVRDGVSCRLRRGDVMRCRNQVGHGFLIGPRIVRRF